MEERKQFTFYRSYYEAIKPLSKKDQAAIILAVAAYALDGDEPKGLSPAATASYLLIKPTLDAGKRKAETMKNRSKAGRKSDVTPGLLPSKPEVKPQEKETEVEIEKELETEIEVEIENDSSLSPLPPLGGAARPQSSTRDVSGQVIELYNRLCPSLPRVKALSEARKKAIRARINQGYSLEDFEQLFTMAEASAFLRGGNGKDWVADFDWLIKDANMAKVLDGKYARFPVHKTSGTDRQRQNEVMTQRVQAGTAALGEHERAAIARMLKEGEQIVQVQQPEGGG